MAQLIGADEDMFPFLIEGDEFNAVCFWNPYNGIMMHLDEDPVRDFATQEFLRENAYPVFDSLKAAGKHAVEREWPRKERPQ